MLKIINSIEYLNILQNKVMILPSRCIHSHITYQYLKYLCPSSGFNIHQIIWVSDMIDHWAFFFTNQNYIRDFKL